MLAYAVVAVVFNWPLPLNLSSELTGQIAGDTGVYVWNLWLFRHEIVAHHSFPLFTNEVLSLAQPIGLSLHNYTLFENLLAFPLIPLLGVTAGRVCQVVEKCEHVIIRPLRSRGRTPSNPSDSLRKRQTVQNINVDRAKPLK